MSQVTAEMTLPIAQALTPRLPAYLEDNYWWAYLRPASLAVFDHSLIVSASVIAAWMRSVQALPSSMWTRGFMRAKYRVPSSRQGRAAPGGLTRGHLEK